MNSHSARSGHLKKGLPLSTQWASQKKIPALLHCLRRSPPPNACITVPFAMARDAANTVKSTTMVAGREGVNFRRQPHKDSHQSRLRPRMTSTTNSHDIQHRVEGLRDLRHRVKVAARTRSQSPPPPPATRTRRDHNLCPPQRASAKRVSEPGDTTLSLNVLSLTEPRTKLQSQAKWHTFF